MVTALSKFWYSVTRAVDRLYENSEYQECIDACTGALEYTRKPWPQTTIVLLQIRGKAYYEVEQLSRAKNDFEELVVLVDTGFRHLGVLMDIRNDAIEILQDIKIEDVISTRGPIDPEEDLSTSFMKTDNASAASTHFKPFAVSTQTIPDETDFSLKIRIPGSYCQESTKSVL
ncbi:hypothetical protein NEOLI_002347 [Neolecta irregularis DAH-3]|uniref:Uncharacterized protein n=1 Tax=Neolecta irregularis (strain DAH-3) TaxID=1198029 RepID=A0A1U7LGL9_NEOID|nr:hypothetical protein NEOLI_002347 [Neolecta irregularis DAH-3]|eukprot:OLL21671.1 hypothetical protein NEOLI_002347 [Neolecta irregularis DAH-3]